MSWFKVSVAAILASVVWSGTAAADTPPVMTHAWRLLKSSWGGACNGKMTHIAVWDAAECAAAKSIGYSGALSVCDTAKTDSADHYVSASPFTGAVEVYRLTNTQPCGCKDSYILTADKAWKASLESSGWKVEKWFYAWDATSKGKAWYDEWGLIPVFHAYSASHCDNIYSAKPEAMVKAYDTQGYTFGPSTEQKMGDVYGKVQGGPWSVAYAAADGWVNLTVTCAGPSGAAVSCDWTLEGPATWSVSGSGTWSKSKLPSHKYKLYCKDILGLTNLSAFTAYENLPYFSSYDLICSYGCANECSFAGQKECSGAAYKVCQAGSYGCLKWSGTTSCNDGNPCTNDGCSAGSCTTSSSSGPCDDGNGCTVNDYCSLGNCISGAPMQCNDGNSCTQDTCSGGNCVFSALSGQSCSDGDPCTTGDKCSGGQCAGATMFCGDGNPCTDDFCNAGTCNFVNNGAACTDGSACTVGDTCVLGSCKGGAPPACDDNNPCTIDQCSAASGCAWVPKAGPCDDGNACTTADACVNGSCKGGAPPSCNDGNPCTEDACNPAVGCINTPNSASCDDGKKCTSGDQCSSGTCAGKPMSCNDGLSCTIDSCEEATGCLNSPNDSACDDANPCTQDVCKAGIGCQNPPAAGPCSDGNPCTEGDSCIEGVCVPGKPATCSDDISCTSDSCDPKAGCQHTPIAAKCDDGLACTTDECVVKSGCENTPSSAACDDANICTADTCIPGVGCTYSDAGAVVCNDNNPCTQDNCDPKAGCSYSQVSGPCDDGKPCTIKDECQAGVCLGETGKCNDGNACTADACNPADGSCSHEAKDGPCDDGDACTKADECVKGACTGTQKVTCPSDGNQCTEDLCDPAAGCTYTPAGGSCADGNPCTEGDTCKEGTCVGGPLKTCNDGNPCTVDSCDAATGTCTHAATAGSCDDGSPCTEGDHCEGGQCTGTSIPACCESAADCFNPMPQCMAVSCVASKCQETIVCAEGACGPNPCDEAVDCGSCFAFEACIGGACFELCDTSQKNVTRCADDETVLEKCTQDLSSGDYYWKPADCIASGEAGCAYSKDKQQFVCCTPSCDGKECGKPSACGVSCGTCGVGEYCCDPGQSCAEANAASKFQCIDCCAGRECGTGPGSACTQSCGACGAGESCKDGRCANGCAQAGVDETGVCTGNVAWWCEVTFGVETLKSVDCGALFAKCCFDPDLDHHACCGCESECAEKGWECGANSCGLPCGPLDGGCPLGFNCIEQTRQCVCATPELCYPGDTVDGDTGPDADVGTAPDSADDETVGSSAIEGSANGDEGCRCRAAGSGFPAESLLLVLFSIGCLLQLRRRSCQRR